jgi:GNAT superfamily N-acetyltransferase
MTAGYMEQPRTTGGVLVARDDASPSTAVVSLFRESFPRHPISRVDDAVARGFLQSFATARALFVAHDSATARDVGFLIGGSTAMLDGLRVEFIRQHAMQIAAASAKNSSLVRMLLQRLRPARSFRAARYSEMQLRFIAVAPEARGLGVGRQLVDAFEQSLEGVAGYHTWTMVGSRGAGRFYDALGFERDITFGEHVRLCKKLG